MPTLLKSYFRPGSWVRVATAINPKYWPMAMCALPEVGTLGQILKMKIKNRHRVMVKFKCTDLGYINTGTETAWQAVPMKNLEIYTKPKGP